MQINFTYDSSITSLAPTLKSEIETVCNAVAQFYDAEFSTPITVNLNIGWGEVKGQTIPSNAVAANVPNGETGPFTYDQIVSLLKGHDNQPYLAAALAGLPATDPTGGGAFYLTGPEARALGIAGAGNTPDGWIGIGSGLNWDFNKLNNLGTNVVPAGQSDLFASIAHEVSEELGRFGGLFPNDYQPLDLFNFTGPGVRTVADSGLRYFSLDNGVTDLLDFNNRAGDLNDWAQYEIGDAFAFANTGIPLQISATDLALMNLLGYATAVSPNPTDYTASNAAMAGTFNFLINNITNAPAPGSTAGVYLSKSATVTTAGTLVASFAAPEIGVQSSVTADVALNLPSTLADGAWFLAAIANPTGAVSETSTTNNTSKAVGIQVVDTVNMASVTSKAGVNAVEVKTATTLTAAVDNVANLNILGTLAGGQYLTIGAGGVLNTAPAGEIIASGTGIDLAAPTTVTNLGTINGVSLPNNQAALEGGVGCTIVNSGLISGYNAIAVSNGSRIIDTGTIDGTGDLGVYLGQTGSGLSWVDVYSRGLIEGAVYGVYAAGPAFIYVTGTISGGVDAVYFKDPGSILDLAATGVLDGAVHGGGADLFLEAGYGTLSGVGNVGGITDFAIYYVRGGGHWTLTGENTLATYTKVDGILTVGDTVTNAGAVVVDSGGLLTLQNDASRLILDPGSILSGNVAGAGGTLELAAGGVAGTLGGLGGAITGFGAYQVDAGGSWTLTGPNVMAGGLNNAGTITNDGTFNVAGAVVNTGTIISSSGMDGTSGNPGNPALAAIVGVEAATITNYGLLQGGAGGVGGDGGAGAGAAGGTGGAALILYDTARATNYGTILGGAGGAGGSGATIGAVGYGGDGVDIVGGAGSALVNSAECLIEGAAAVFANGSTTVTNAGTMIGTGYVGDSVIFLNASDRLIVAAGSAFVGAAYGGGGALELGGGKGTITGLGANGTLSGATSLIFNHFGSYLVDAGASWTLTGSNVVGAGKTLASQAAGVITLANGQTLQAGGAIANAGSLNLASAGGVTALRVLASGASLTGGGTVTMSGPTARIIGASASATLTNVNDIIAGAGFIGVGLLTLVNEAAGVIDATGLIDLRTSGTLANAGLIEATKGGTLNLISTTVTGTGTLDAAGGAVNLEGVTVDGGTTLASTGTSAIRVNAAAVTLEGAASAVMLTGALQVLKSHDLTIDGALVNSGKLNLFAGTITAGAAGITLSGGGSVILNGNALNTIGGTTTLTNLNNRITGSGSLGKGTLTLINDGVIVDPQSVGLTIDTGANTIINGGTIGATAAGGGVTVKSALNNTGQLLASGGGTLSVLGTVTGAGVGRINGGTLYVAGAFAENVSFLSATGVLKLGDSQAFTGKVSSLSGAGTNSLDLMDIAFVKATTTATYSGTVTGGALTVTDGTHTAHIALTGNYLASTFTLSSDKHGGTSVVDPAPLVQAAAGWAPGPGHTYPLSATSTPYRETLARP